MLIARARTAGDLPIPLTWRRDETGGRVPGCGMRRAEGGRHRPHFGIRARRVLRLCKGGGGGAVPPCPVH